MKIDQPGDESCPGYRFNDLKLNANSIYDVASINQS